MPTAAAAAPQSTALTIVERVEKSPAVMAIDANSQALVDLLPDAAAVSRFRRVVIQALMKNPELLECTPESVVRSVFEAAAMGLEPTGASGGAHLVPYNVKVSKNPERYEKQAQLIPDYRGIIRLVTKEPTQLLSLEARVVKEGDEFAYAEGTEAVVHHVPSLSPQRSAKATTHVYAIARLKNGTSIPDVMDHAAVERIQKRGRGAAFSPWASDWDEMAKKTVIKRISKILPVRPEVRSILVREDELGDGEPGSPAAAPTGPTKVSRLAQRLAVPATTAPADPPAEPGVGDVVEGSFTEAPADEPTLGETIRIAAAASDLEGPASADDVAGVLGSTFKGWSRELVLEGIRTIFGDEAVNHPSSAQVAALRLVGDSLPAVQFLAGWRELAAGAQA